METHPSIFLEGYQLVFVLFVIFFVGVSLWRLARWCTRAAYLCRRRDRLRPLPWVGTALEALPVVVYVGVNAAIIGLGSDRSKTSAIAAVLPMLPLALLGKPNILANRSGISLPGQSRIHQWLGYIAIINGTVHAYLALMERKEWDLRSRSGVGLLIAFSSFFISSIPQLRQKAYAIFKILHISLLVLTFCGLTIHLTTRTNRICALAYIALSILVPVCRWGVAVWRGRVHKLILSRSGDSVVVNLSLRRPLSVLPGGYFYVQVGSFYKIPMIVYSWDPDYTYYPTPVALPRNDKFDWSDNSPSNTSAESNATGHGIASTKVAADSSVRRNARPVQTQNFIFLAQTKAIASVFEESGSGLRLEGPYGQDLQLERYQDVTLVAHGANIGGILSYALFLGQRRYHDDTQRDLIAHEMKNNDNYILSRNSLWKDHVTRVKIYWALEHQEQDSLAKDEFAKLMALDPKGKLFKAMLLYPKPLDKKKNEDKKDTFKVPPEHTKHWQRVHVSRNYQPTVLQKLLSWDTHDPGNAAVVVCGSSLATDVRQFMRKQGLDSSFFEVECPEHHEWSLGRITSLWKSPLRPEKSPARKLKHKHPNNAEVTDDVIRVRGKEIRKLSHVNMV